MLDAINRKKDIYDARPEDHPQYPEEWRIFWEKRYKEVEAQGKNADKYDYKTDWIPYWQRKVSDLYRNETRTKTEDLLRKYDLKSDQEPFREQFVDKRSRNAEGNISFKVKKSSKTPKSRILFLGSALPFFLLMKCLLLYIWLFLKDFGFLMTLYNHFTEYRGGGGGAFRRSPDRDRYRYDRERSSRQRSRSRSRERRDHHRRSFSPPPWQRHGSHGRSRSPGFDAYSGISVLENIRDGRRSGSPPLSSYDSFSNAPKLLDTLRLITALENLLGSLGPQITAMMSRALTLENKRPGSSNVILQDANSAAVLELTKEKLAGQIVAGK